MSIDMSQFYQVFFEETAEHLENMEALLLGLDLMDPDTEQLNAIFRAAHSIKGSSGTFGFTDLAEVTHILENLLDRVRKGELSLREDMIDAFLDAGDVLKTLLAAHRGQGVADPATVEAICNRLRDLTQTGDRKATPQTHSGDRDAAPPASPALTSSLPAQDSARANGEIGLTVAFVLADDGGESAIDSLLGELSGLFGAARVIERPEQPDRPWRIELPRASPVDADNIRNMLEFVARSDSIRIARSAGETSGEEDGDGAYGFFAPSASRIGEEATATDVAYGFFTPLPAAGENGGEPAYGFFAPLPTGDAAVAPSGENEAYGFFTPLAKDGPFETSTAVPATESTAAPADAAEGAYGFFAPLPTPPATSTPVAEQEARAGSEGGAHGFFVDVPKPTEPPVAIASQESETNPSAAAGKTTGEDGGKRDEERAKVSPSGTAKTATKAASTDASIRVGVDKVDQLINLVGELVITQAMLAQSASQIDPVEFERLHNGLAQLERNTRDLQEAVMSIRMMPMSVVFSRFPRVVRDLSQKLGKQVELKLIGENTELDKSLIERITDPLTHLVRNSLDHGIEMPEVRAAKGKQPVGTITLKAYHQSGNIVIEVSDDGAGLNRQKILAKARDRGLPIHEQMSDAEVWQLIFEPGFSTADQITEVSGRGVGMDVVKKNISSMGGRVDIESMAGIGTRMTVRLPLTLAILDGMSVAVGRETYIIPLGYVIESLQAEPGMIKSISGVERLLHVRGEYLPIVALHEVFHVENAQTDLQDGIMIILEADGIKAAMFVDAMVGQHQVVIKSLEANYRKVPGIAGATIMGDGHVALILDVSALVGIARNALPLAA